MKKKWFMKIIGAFTVCIMLLTGCGGDKTAVSSKYALPKQIAFTESKTIASNDTLSLAWNSEQSCLILRDAGQNEICASVPLDYYRSEDRSNEYTAAGIASSLYICCVDSEGTERTLHSYYDAAFIASKQIKNGIRLTYYFDSVNISVPVEYTLNQDGITAAILTDGIKEGDYKLYTVSVLPFFAGVKNGDDTQLFVPSGCGAMMNTDDGVRGVRTYREPVYGGDASAQEMYQNENAASVRMPVFGSLSSAGSVLGIVENGAEQAYINAVAGDEQYGYSSVYAEFSLRSKANATVKDINNLNVTLGKYTDTIADSGRLTVRYIVLKPSDNGFIALADVYRAYLTDRYKIEENQNGPLVMLNILGGVQEKKMLFGIPYTRTTALTSFEQAQSILRELRNVTDAGIAVNLKGFGASGIDNGKLADGFRISGIYGGEKDFYKLKEWCEENGTDLFLDFDVVNFGKSGGGYSVRRAARSAKGTVSKLYTYDIVTHEQKTDDSARYLLGRYELARIGNDLSAAVKRYSLSGVGLSALSSISYSDSSDPLYYACAHMSDDAMRAIGAVRKQKSGVMTEQANLYAAILSDCVIHTPTSSSGYRYFDGDVPFYQAVLHGTVPISGGIINLAADPQAEFLRTVSTGSAVAFAFTEKEASVAVKERHAEIGYTVYEGWRQTAADMITKAEPLIKAVNDCHITAYTKSGDLSKTVFDNGIVVYVNFGAVPIDTPIGSLSAYSFIYG